MFAYEIPGQEPGVWKVEDDWELYGPSQREIFIDNLMVRDHLIIEMILVDRPCAMGV